MLTALSQIWVEAGGRELHGGSIVAFIEVWRWFRFH